MADHQSADTQDATAVQEDPPSSPSPQSQPQRETGSNALVVHPQRQHVNWLKRWPSSLAAVGLALLIAPFAWISSSEEPIDPTNYALRTQRVLKTTPLIDGHNDLPWLLRIELHNKIREGNPSFQRLLGHTDIARMRQGMMGGQFWSVYVDCDAAAKHFEDPSWTIRDTLEQIDVTKRFIAQYSDTFAYCTTSSCVRSAFKSGRIASMLGIEGGHQLGSSIASIRQAYDLGVRYITTTHNCDNAWATAATTVMENGPEVDLGLTRFGAAYVKEMNRLGMLIDLSHVSHQTMRDVLSLTQTPIIFSHSGAYAKSPHLRNVPDDVLRSVKKNGGIVMAVFVDKFLNIDDPGAATIHDAVDHIWHIAEVAGWEHVGIGADFSGTPHTAVGLEDVSKYPHLVELLMERGATDEQMRQLVGENFLRVWAEVEQRAKEIQSEEGPVEDEWEGRKWHVDRKSAPFMFRGTREKAVKESWPE